MGIPFKFSGGISFPQKKCHSKSGQLPIIPKPELRIIKEFWGDFSLILNHHSYGVTNQPRCNTGRTIIAKHKTWNGGQIRKKEKHGNWCLAHPFLKNNASYHLMISCNNFAFCGGIPGRNCVSFQHFCGWI